MTPIPFAKPYFSTDARAEILSAIDRILTSGRLMLGEFTSKLESAFAGYIGASHAVSTNSCTTALQICLMHYDIRGHEVLIPAAGFTTDVSVVRWAGGTPVLVDIDPATLSFDIEDLRRKVTQRTKGLIWIHLTGVISPAWRQIVELARERGLFLIEDCAHAHGASLGGRKAGTFGDAACFSFYATKVMTTGTGGLLTTNDAALANTAKELRLFGRENGVGKVVREGNDWFLDEIRACLGYFQLRDLEAALERRREIAARYDARLTGTPGLHVLRLSPDSLPAWYHYTVFISDAVDYDRLAQNLREIHGIPTKQIYLPLHQEDVFRNLDDGTLSNTERTLNRSMCLPVFVEMTDAQVDCVVEALKRELTVAS